MNTPHGANREFPDTSWTLLKQASDSDEAAASAVSEFAARYYAAVCSFIKVIVRDDDLAQDFTQEFFQERVLRAHGVIAQANAAKGRFRPFLKQTIRNFLVDKHRALARSPRGDVRPDAMPGHWDGVLVDGAEAADDTLVREWGQSIVTLAIERVKSISASKGQDEHFAMFAKRYLSNPDDPPSFREVGGMFGLDEKTARGRVQTVVTQFRLQLGNLLRSDAGTDGDVDQEIRTLIGLL